MRVACIQLTSGENYKKNFSDITKFINLAIKKKSDLIITPETSSIITNNKKLLFKNSFRMRKDPLVMRVKEIAKEFKKWIIIGSIPIKDGKKLRNRSILFNPNGKISKYYDKINMFDVTISKKEKYTESKIFKAGSKLVTAKLPWGNIGFSICYDLRFPEIYRNLSKKKISFLIVPSAFTKKTGKKHWISLLKARAIENFCFVFAPNQTGNNTAQRKTFGHSAIISPDGKILRLKKKGKGIIYCDVDPNEPIKLRKIIPSLRNIKIK